MYRTWDVQTAVRILLVAQCQHKNSRPVNSKLDPNIPKTVKYIPGTGTFERKGNDSISISIN